MAANQVSLFFYPPRWEQRLTPHPRSLSDQGTPVQYVDAIRVDGAHKLLIVANDLRDWLIQHEFTAVDWGHGSAFERGQVRSVFGIEKEIDISFSEEDGELTSVYCRFTLSRDTPTDLPKWAAFAVAMCQRFQLRLGAAGSMPCSEKEFLTAVRANRFWQGFASSCGWVPEDM